MAEGLSRTTWGVATLVGVLLLCGCEVIVGPRSFRQVGVLAISPGDPPRVVAPDTVQAAVPFEVSIRTYGGGCVSKGDEQVGVQDRVIFVRPYDIHSGHSLCTADLALFNHLVLVSLPTPGPVTLRVLGRELPADTLIVIERRLMAR